MAKKKVRLTSTPRWLSVTRKMYTYIGGSSIFTVISEKYGLTPESLAFMVQIYLAGQFLLQILCDTYFVNEDDIYKEN